ncbi:MAG TPA: hypothetical protein VJA26_08135 [Gammaproteobacteria bacterium]|nr:hypothetical protein [Gammaproteobacteria bacterium]
MIKTEIVVRGQHVDGSKTAGAVHTERGLSVEQLRAGFEGLACHGRSTFTTDHQRSGSISVL